MRERRRPTVGASPVTGFLARWPLAIREAAGVRSFVIAAVAGLFLGLIGPFGSSEAALGVRLVYWLLLAEVGTGIGVLTATTVMALMGRGASFGGMTFLAAGVTAAAMTLPGAVVVWAITRFFFQGPGKLQPNGGIAGFIAPVFVVSTAISLINALANRNPPHTHAAAPDAPPSRFADRLPAKLRGADIYAVEAEDHYLRLHTSKGSDLILMRLSDAISELEGVEGAQTHRSWWVARGAVQSARKLDGRAILTLPGAVEAPVSRGYARALRAEGWF
jgi:DNA-binding LytR/AlgR family response regulator